MDCKANIVVIPGSGPVHNMEKPMIPPSSCHREAAQTAACGNGGRNAVDLFGIVSCDEDTLNYAQARSGGFPGLVLPEPLGSQVSRTPMYSMGGGGVTHHLNSVDRHSCMRQVGMILGHNHCFCKSFLSSSMNLCFFALGFIVHQV